MKGQKALFPQGYHCTGMPIKAAADKLKREIEMFGQKFENVPSDDLEQLSLDEKTTGAKTDMGKFSGTKSKAAAKSGKAKYQYEVCRPKYNVSRWAGVDSEPDHAFPWTSP